MISVQVFPRFAISSQHDLPSFSIGITGYSKLASTEQIKNALFYLGDVAASVNWLFGNDNPDNLMFNVANTTGVDSEGVIWPSIIKAEHDKAHVGAGFSFSSDSIRRNHVVAIVGWAPCTVKDCKSKDVKEKECWILQDSHGLESGYEGCTFIDNDTKTATQDSAKKPLFPWLR